MLFAVTGLELAGVAALLLLVAATQRKTLSRVGAAIGAQFGKVGRLIWGFDPIAVYQQQVDEAAEEIKAGVGGLEQYRGLKSQFERKVENGKKEVAVYEARAKLHVQAGRDKEATEALSAKKKAETDLAANQHTLEQYAAAYENNLKKIKFAQDKVNKAKEEAAKLQAELRMSKVEAETARLAQSFNVNTGSLNQLAEVRDEIQRQIDNNRAKAQVATDLSNDGLADIEAEEALRQEEAAADLKKLKEEMGKV